MKNKKSLFAIIAVLLVVVVGATFAYFQSSASFENIFNTGTYKVVTTEVFESPDNWKPGEEIPKTITTKNEGTIPAAVRVKYTEKWEDLEGNDITSTIDEGTAIINLDNTSEWIKEGNYYYYKYILEPNDTTSSFIKSVTLNSELNDVTCTGEGLTKTCETTNPATGAKYKLTITKETVQADKYKEVWNTNVEIVEKILPIGTAVDYSTSLNGVTLDEWKVFYNEDGYTYLILNEYLPVTAISTTLKDDFKLMTDGTYFVWTNYNRDILLASLTTKSNWDELLTGTLNGSIEINETRTDNVWAMGSPDLELWVNSWNTKYPTDKLYVRYEDNVNNEGYDGYYIGDSPNPSTYYINLSETSGANDLLYFPLQGNFNYRSYWLASPSANYSQLLMSAFMSSSSVGGSYIMDDNAFRPVIRIPTSLLFQ